MLLNPKLLTMTVTIRPYKNKFKKLIFSILTVIGLSFSGWLTSCSSDIKNAHETNRVASIYPDYYDLILPPNIAPLNFIINEPGTKFRVEISGENGKLCWHAKTLVNKLFKPVLSYIQTLILNLQ